jgi:primosomal protein N' (replication factor Y)
MNVYAEVVFPIPVPRSFSYLVPARLRETARLGTRVSAPFGRGRRTGVIVHLRTRAPSGVEALKEIEAVLDPAPVFTPRFLAFTRRLAAFHYSSWGEMLEAARPPSAEAPVRARVALTPAGRRSLERDALGAREKAVAGLLGEKAFSRVFLQRRLRDRALGSLLAGMEKKGLIEVRERATRPRPPRTGPGEGATAPASAVQLPLDFAFRAEARSAGAEIKARLEKGGTSLSYLFAPDTDREAVYLDLVRTVLAGGGRALFLLPEIAASGSLRESLERKLGERAAVLHSRLTGRQKDSEWGKIGSGRASVVVGPRSALFAPVRGLGLIVADEEQDESLQQAENPAFDARQGVVFRAETEGAAAVLGSARPSVTWFHRAEAEGFLSAVPPGASPAGVRLVDMNREKPPFSRTLEDGIRRRLAAGEPVLVFLNRRGYASSLVCPRCRHVPTCPRCGIPLTFFKRENKLSCRYCRFEAPAPARCPRCRGSFLGGRDWGIEALEEEVRRRYPAARVARVDRDAAGRGGERKRVLGEASRGGVDILLGTELLAHQPDLPSASLVAILDPEAPLAWSDYRAGQRTYQGLVRMMTAARPGRTEPAEVVIQTTLPEHHSIRFAAAGDYRGFYEAEVGFRRLMGYPPFSWMAEVLFEGREARALAAQVRGFTGLLGSAGPGVEVLGQTRSGLGRVRGLTRFQVLIRAQKKERLDAALGEAMDRTASIKAVRLFD